MKDATKISKSSKPPKHPGGRPRSYGGDYSPGSVNLSIRVPIEVYERLREWGSGSVTRGIVAAVEKVARLELDRNDLLYQLGEERSRE